MCQLVHCVPFAILVLLSSWLLVHDDDNLSFELLLCDEQILHDDCLVLVYNVCSDSGQRGLLRPVHGAHQPLRLQDVDEDFDKGRSAPEGQRLLRGG